MPVAVARTLHARGAVQVNATGRVVAMRGTDHDITRQKALADELRLLSTHIQSAREEKRRRLAREIHDELGGALTGIKMQLKSLRERFDRQETPARWRPWTSS